MNKNLIKDSVIGSTSFQISQLKAFGGYAGMGYNKMILYRLAVASYYEWQACWTASYNYSFAQWFSLSRVL